MTELQEKITNSQELYNENNPTSYPNNEFGVVESEPIAEFEEAAKKMAVEIDKRKGENIILLDTRSASSLFDYMLIASGQSYVHIRSLSELVEEEMSKLGYGRKNSRENIEQNPWILIDFGFIIIHLFHTEAREYYGLERLWENNNIILKSGVSSFGKVIQ
jgi:ribosome-associated protein